MKTLFVISPHSFVDLITNSSTELFICDTTKTKEAVESVLTRLLDMHNELLECPNHYTMGDCFAPITVAQFTFDLDKFPDGLGQQYRMYERCRDYGYRGEPRPNSYYRAKEAMELLDLGHPLRTTKWTAYDSRTEKEKKEYDKCWRNYHEQQDAIWTQFGLEKLVIRHQLFIAFLKENGFSEEDVALVRGKNAVIEAEYKLNNRGEYGYGRYNDDELPKNLLDAAEYFDECLSYGIRVQKGNIIVRGASDNSIPYGLFDLLRDYLKARSYHLG